MLTKGAIKEILKRTSVAALMSAVSLPLSVWSWTTSLLDGEWVRGLERAKQAGGLLADVLLEKTQGQRPVHLVGASFGALTVFECLLRIAEKSPNNNDLIYSATMISLPLGPSTEEWQRARGVVAGPLTQAYSTNDWCLALLSRAAITAKFTIRRPAGLAAVEEQGVVDLDVSEWVFRSSTRLC
jgi:alpha-beta hydrolase superfamily lysophospholipase